MGVEDLFRLEITRMRGGLADELKALVATANAMAAMVDGGRHVPPPMMRRLAELSSAISTITAGIDATADMAAMMAAVSDPEGSDSYKPGGRRVRDELAHSGHGHVVHRTDGRKARCGGPGRCSGCDREQSLLDRMEG